VLYIFASDIEQWLHKILLTLLHCHVEKKKTTFHLMQIRSGREFSDINSHHSQRVLRNSFGGVISGGWRGERIAAARQYFHAAASASRLPVAALM
jgi:hypothetical protein